jgi:hypothetical protein
MDSGSIGSADWIHRNAVVNGVRLHYVECGSGPLVILLHGFPEFWYAWRYQIPALAAPVIASLPLTNAATMSRTNRKGSGITGWKPCLAMCWA